VGICFTEAQFVVVGGRCVCTPALLTCTYYLDIKPPIEMHTADNARWAGMGGGGMGGRGYGAGMGAYGSMGGMTAGGGRAEWGMGGMGRQL
jgi:hypothetical protein